MGFVRLVAMLIPDHRLINAPNEHIEEPVDYSLIVSNGRTMFILAN
jgi:hypothetical protein